MSRFAPRPEPPYCAVIFTSQPTTVENGCGTAAECMAALAASARHRTLRYAHNELRIAKFDRPYGWDRSDGTQPVDGDR